MKRLMTLAVIMMLMTVANAQKLTNYKFRFDMLVVPEMDSIYETDLVIDINDRPGETPTFIMNNKKDGTSDSEEINPGIVYETGHGVITFSTKADDTYFCFNLSTDDNGAKSCILTLVELEDGVRKVHYVFMNESDTPSNKQCLQAYQALLKSVKAKSFNNYKVQTID